MARAMEYNTQRNGWAAIAVLLALMLALSALAAPAAHASTPESEVPPPPIETEIPPTEPDPEPTETEAPLPPETEAPEPTETEAPEPEGTATEEPTAEPTTEPTPVITWSQPEPVRCELQPGATSALNFNDAATYNCVVYANVSSDANMPADMQIAWTLELDFADSYQLAFPQGSLAEVTLQQPGETATITEYTISHPWNAENNRQQLEFDLIITRTTCAVGERVLTAQAEPAISTSAEAEILWDGVQPDPEHATASYLPNTDTSSVSMSPVDFGSLTWQDGSWGTTWGTGIVTVTNDNPCATDQTQNVTMEVIASSPGLSPVIAEVSVGGETIESVPAGDPNEAATVIAHIPAGFDGTAEIEVIFELSPTTEVSVGDHTFEFRVTVTAAP